MRWAADYFICIQKWLGRKIEKMRMSYLRECEQTRFRVIFIFGALWLYLRDISSISIHILAAKQQLEHMIRQSKRAAI